MIFVMLLGNICYRIFVLYKFAFVFTDSDQSIMWYAENIFSSGRFPEPRFFGQDYNTMLEALLAVPFVSEGFSVYFVLPVITSVLTLFPFILISYLTFLKKSRFSAILILAIPLILPIEYHFITCMPRGFVTGLFFAGFCTLPLFFEQSKLAYFMAGFATIFAYSVNANSIIFSLSCCLLVFLYHFRDKNLYLYGGAGLIMALGIHFAIAQFYVNHPNYVLHSYVGEFSFSNLIYGLQHLDNFFGYVTPIFLNQGWFIFILFLLFLFLFIKAGKINEIIFIGYVFMLLILPLAYSKVHDGTDSVFFSYSRMFLGVPLLLAICISRLQLDQFCLRYGLIMIVPALLIGKIERINDSIENAIKNESVVAVAKVNDILTNCQKLSYLGKENEIDYLIIANHWFYDFYTYGCSACISSFPNTLRPIYERRTWSLIEDMTRVYRNIFILDVKHKLDDEYKFVTAVDGFEGLYMIQRNELTTQELLQRLKIEVRKF